MSKRSFIFGVVLFSLFLIGAGDATAKCAAGEVWGDVGCRPAAQPSVLVKAARRIKTFRLHRKLTKQPEPETKRQAPATTAH